MQNQKERGAGRARFGDKLLMMTIALAAAASLGLGMQSVEARTAVWATALLAAPALAVFFVAQGTILSRFVLTFSLMGFVALHIQLTHGMIEMHFGVFVVLAFLLVYLDTRANWRAR